MAPRTSPPRRARRAAAALAGALSLLALPLAACGGDDSSGAGAPKPERAVREAATVKIADFKFKPAAVTIKAGGTVTFANTDKAPHTAQTELNPKTAEFDTDRLEKGDTRTVKLENPGRFKYFCAYHRFMEGTVEVVE